MLSQVLRFLASRFKNPSSSPSGIPTKVDTNAIAWKLPVYIDPLTYLITFRSWAPEARGERMPLQVFNEISGFVGQTADQYGYHRDQSSAAKGNRNMGAILAFPWRTLAGDRALDILTWRTLNEVNPMICNRRIFERDGSVDVARKGGFREVGLLEAAKFAGLRRYFRGDPKQMCAHPDLDAGYWALPWTDSMPQQIVARGVFKDRALRLYVCDSVGQALEGPVTQVDVSRAVEYAIAMKDQTLLGQDDVKATFAIAYGYRPNDQHVLGVDLFGFASLGTPNTRIYCRTLENHNKIPQDLEGITCEQGLLVLAAQAPLRRSGAFLDDQVFAELPEGFERRELFEIK